jgi:hypothetical protein
MNRAMHAASLWARVLQWAESRESFLPHIAPRGNKRKRGTVLHFPDDASPEPRPEYKSMRPKRID